MHIKFFRSLWGMDNLPLDKSLRLIKEAGFDGVEAWIPDDSTQRRLLRELLRDLQLDFIAQIASLGDTPEQHINFFRQRYELSLDFAPILMSSHTARDCYSLEDNVKILSAAIDISAKGGIPVVHETHRIRWSYAPWTTQRHLEALPDLRINADFSHWCCVTESMLEDQQEAIRLAASRADHIHARVGHREGPQVSDPRAPEWKYAVDAHLEWWDLIVQNHEARNSPLLTITPEFGPCDYMPALPYTRQPVADLWEINVYMKDMLKKRYEKHS
jgi:sugar phosphate isomerase/epimerase